MPTAATIPIIAATPDDVDLLGGMMTSAFYRCPDVAWLMPDPTRRAIHLPRFSRALLQWCIAADGATVDMTNDRAAAAVWWDHDAVSPAEYQKLVEDNCGPYAVAVLDLAYILALNTPDRPYRYLAYLGVQPARQGTGLGSALLRHQHAVLDREGRCAYLVATTEASRDLYLRHGYTLTRQEPIRPGDGPDLWPMWREPTAAGSAQETRTPGPALTQLS